jgi:16S rRNA (guanine527-N7)-methyltransferase
MERLKELCALNGIELPEEAYRKLEEFKELLKKWGRRINLTSILQDREIEEKHLFDSLLGLKAFKDYGLNLNGEKICDVGSGAGLPGVPLSVALKGAEFTLVEPRKKRCFFLEEVKRRLKLKNLKVECRRIEEVEGEFKLLTMRAVEDPKGAVGITEHLLEKGAVLCIYRGKEPFKGSIQGYKITELTYEPKGVPFIRRFLFIEKGK